MLINFNVRKKKNQVHHYLLSLSKEVRLIKNIGLECSITS